MAFELVITTIGAAKLAAAAVGGPAVALAEMAAGDGNNAVVVPDPAQTQLVNERWRAALSDLYQHPEDPAQFIAEGVIQVADEGGWTVREAGVFDDNGDLIAVASIPPTYKPDVEEGSAREILLRLVFEVANADDVTLQIDPSVILATRTYADAAVAAEAVARQTAIDDAIVFEHLQGIPEWDAALAYQEGSFVRSNKTIYVSLADDNINHDPEGPSAQWARYPSAADIDFDDTTSGLGAGTLQGAIDALAEGRLNKAGDAMEGPLTLEGDPDEALHAATKQYVDARQRIAAGSVSSAGTELAGLIKALNVVYKGTAAFDISGADADKVQVRWHGAGGSTTGLYSIRVPTGKAITDYNLSVVPHGEAYLTAVLSQSSGQEWRLTFYDIANPGLQTSTQFLFYVDSI